MADRSGSVMGFRANAGPLSIKVTRSEMDPEIKVNRSVTTDALLNPRSVLTQNGGILKLTGYVDPSNAASAFLLASIGPTGTAQDLTSCIYLIDLAEVTGSRHGYTFGSCKLVVLGLTGQTDEAGMQEINFEIHSQAGVAYSSTLT